MLGRSMATTNCDSMKDFFISYTGPKRIWAEWIAWHLGEAGYATILQS
jgi:TIR domain